MHEIGRRKPSQLLLWTALCWTLGLFPTLAPLPAEGQARPNEPDLSVVRSALKKYEDPYLAMGHPPLIPMELTHYDLHVWLYKPNPLGTFAPTNPTVSRTGHPYRLVEEAPKLVPEPKP